MMCMERPEPFIVTDDQGFLTLEPEMKRRLEESEAPVVVVAVVGAYRTGKSFLLNRLMGKQDGFPLGSTVQSKTKGIWGWISRHPRFPDRLLLLLDTEGLSDPEKANADHDIWIFSLALLLSNIFVYNSKGVIDNDALEKLHMVSELTEHLRIKSGGEEEGEEFHAFFPDFIWAVRDFFLKCEVNEKEVTPTEYMEWHLKLKKGKGKDTMRANSIREAIQGFFDSRHCFLFPFPVDQHRLQNLESVPVEEMDSKFCEVGEQFVNHILSQESTKSIYGKAVTGRMFLILVETYLATIKGGAVPSVETAVDYMAASENQKAKEAAVEAYNKEIQGLKLPAPSQKLLEAESRAKKTAVDLFLNRALFDKNNEGSVALGLELNELYHNLVSKNESASVEASKQMLERLYAPIRSKVQGGFFLKPGGYNLYESEMANMSAKYMSCTKLGDEAEKVLTNFFSERNTERRQILAADGKLSEEQKRTEEERRRKKMFEQQTERQAVEMRRLKSQQEQMNRDHQETLQRHEAEMQKKMDQEKRELERKIVVENRRQQELMRNGHKEEAARLEARLRQMQNIMDRKVS